MLCIQILQTKLIYFPFISIIIIFKRWVLKSSASYTMVSPKNFGHPLSTWKTCKLFALSQYTIVAACKLKWSCLRCCRERLRCRRFLILLISGNGAMMLCMRNFVEDKTDPEKFITLMIFHKYRWTVVLHFYLISRD